MDIGRSVTTAARAAVGTVVLLLLPGSVTAQDGSTASGGTVITWETDFLDEFEFLDSANWQDQLLWVNEEDQCYVPGGAHKTREVSNGTLKLRVIDLGAVQPCSNVHKSGAVHPGSSFVAARLTSKNRREFVGGRWTARLRVQNSGQPGMFPAWWLLGAQNNEPPVQEDDEYVCWPMTGSGEIDIFEHHGEGGPDRYAARIIESEGYCGGGNWQASMLVQEAPLDQFHEYAVAWIGEDLVFTLDGKEVYRLTGKAALLPEPMFAVLNFAKIKAGPIRSPWVMEVDWVKHERIRNLAEVADVATPIPASQPGRRP